jgi:hypothetical protein
MKKAKPKNSLEHNTLVMLEQIKKKITEEEYDFLLSSFTTLFHDSDRPKVLLSNEILTYLRKNPYSTAKKISANVNASRQECNSIMHTTSREDKPYGLFDKLIKSEKNEWSIK